MTKYAKQKVLYQLNFLKSIGYEFSEGVSLRENVSESIDLPNDLNALESMVSNCHLCHLSKYRANVLFGYGNANASLMFIGDEPSISEDETGEFYAGRIGALLAKMLQSVLNVEPEDVYITNIVKCKTSHNQISAEEFGSCKAYLQKQIELVNPKLIVPLGEMAYSFLTNDHTPFAKIRGQVSSYGGREVLPTFHPSFLLRNPTSKKEAYYDMLKIKSIMERV